MYHRQAFSQRFETLGDKSEAIFKKWATKRGLTFIRFGLDRPPFKKFKYLPENIRYLPDYLCEDGDSFVQKNYHRTLQSHFFVEVKACGKDQTLKIKRKTLTSLHELERVFARPVLFFFYDSHKQRVSLRYSAAQIARIARDVPLKQFPEGTEYYAIPADTLKWDPVDRETTDDDALGD